MNIYYYYYCIVVINFSMSETQNYSVKNDPRFDTAQWRQAIGPQPTALNDSPIIFLDTTDGSDSNDGQTGAVQSFEKAVDVANGFDNATIDILSTGTTSLNLDSYMARNSITVTGASVATTDLESSVVTATPEVTYETNTVITVADTLVAAALVGKILTFTSGSFVGQSFAIITNAVSSITIAGNVTAAASDTFQVTTPTASLVQSSGNVTWKGTWSFTSILCGTTANEWLADCDSCLTFTASTSDVVLDSNKQSSINIIGCYVIQDFTTEFSDSWLIRNTLISGATLTFNNTDNLFQNVRFEDAPFVTENAELRLENCYYNTTGLLIQNSSYALLTNFVCTVTDGSTVAVFATASSEIRINDNTLVDGSNAISNVFGASGHSSIKTNQGAITIDTSTLSASSAFSINTGSTLETQVTAITLTGDIGRVFNLRDSDCLCVGSSLTLSGNTIGTAIFDVRNSLFRSDMTVSATGITTPIYYNLLDSTKFVATSAPVTIDGTVSTVAINVQGSELTFTSMALDLNSGTSSPVGVLARSGSKVYFQSMSAGSEINSVSTTISADKSDIVFDDCTSLTLNVDAAGSCLTATGTSNVKSSAGAPVLGGAGLSYIIGGNAPVAGQLVAGFTNDLGAGTPQGATLSNTL